jgi:ATP-binding cassette, subfamily B, bacterial PglK
MSKKKNNPNVIIKSVKSLIKHTSSKQKKRLSILSILIFLSAIFDVVGLAAVLPLIKAGTDPEMIHSNFYLNKLFVICNFSNENYFVLFLISILLGYFLFKTAFGISVNWFQARLSSNITVFISRNQFSKYFMLDFIDYNRIKSSIMIRNILYNPTSYTQWIVQPLLMILSESIIVILIIGAIAYYDIFLFIFVLATIGPATYVVYKGLKNKSSQVGIGMNQVFPYAISSLTEAISGYIDLKLADKLTFYREKFLRHYKDFQDLQQKAYLLNQIPLRTNEVIALMGIILIFVYAMFLAEPGTDVIMLVGAFAAAAYRLMPSINRILNSMMYLNKNQVTVDNLDLFENLINKEASTTTGIQFPFKNSIAFEKISFSFPDMDMPVLDEVSLEVKKGEKIGFVGTSGSGKTTLMNVLLRFYNEDSGGLKVDGTSLTHKHTQHWRSLIGYVKQDVFIIDGTILENIVLGDPDYDDDRLNLAIKQASLEGLVNTLGNGLNSLVGEKGNNLSGGQRQRIGIARSLYREAEILVFDEATSALDSDTENEVTEAMNALSTINKTVFIIAHRVTTLRNCDRIYELKDGKIDGVYSYDELIKRTK